MSRVMVDVCVVGRELCGLVAGALAAQAGRRVLIIDDGDVPARPLGDRLAPIAPSLWRLPTAGPAALVLDELGFKADARRILGEPLGLGVVDDPDLRCVFPVTDDARVRELGRALGAAGRALATTLSTYVGASRHAALTELRALHEDGWFFEARRAKKRVLALGASASIDAPDVDVEAVWGDGSGVAPVLTQLAAFVQWRSASAVRGLGGAQALATLAGGSVLGAGGPGGLGPRAALADMLSAFIVTHGGEVRRDRVAAIELKGKVVTALRTEHKSDEIVPVAVVDATSARDLVDRLPSGRAREKLLTQQGRVVVSGGATAVRWLVPVRALPRGIPPSLLILDDAGALPILASICMGAPLSDTGKGAHLDDTHVCVVAVGATRESGAVEEALVRLMPFCRGAAKANDVVDASAVAGHFEIKDSEHVLGGRRPRTVLKNLVRAGRDLAPAWGTDGELVAARAVHSLVQKQFPKVPKPTE